MKETLTCSMCSKTWKREMSRGRKPTVCPKCVKSLDKEKAEAQKSKDKTIKQTSTSTKLQRKSRKIEAKEVIEKQSEIECDTVHTKTQVSIYDVYNSLYPKPSNFKEFLESTKNGSKWFCNSCKKTLNSEIPLSVPPTHRCPSKSSNIKEYERIS